MPHLLAAPDKLKGTATAGDVASAIGRAASACGWTWHEVPLADGGEGIVDVIGGTRRRTIVHGPLGEAVEAEWVISDGVAVVEMASASGLVLVGGPEGNDPVAASTRGTGELIEAAVAAGARRVIVGVGGSATTDGGWGAVAELGAGARMHGVEVVVACDVATAFADAAADFAPQKGASPAEVRLLERRLRRLVQVYLERFGVDVSELRGGGAAGGLAGGLAALGADLVPGFELVAEHVGLAEELEAADLVVTAEGRLDRHSFEGKVVGGVLAMARGAGVPAVVVAGEVEGGAGSRLPDVEVVSLSERHGRERSLAAPLQLLEEDLSVLLGSVGRSRP